jgi:hypothetical protein
MYFTYFIWLSFIFILLILIKSFIPVKLSDHLLNLFQLCFKIKIIIFIFIFVRITQIYFKYLHFQFLDSTMHFINQVFIKDILNFFSYRFIYWHLILIFIFTWNAIFQLFTNVIWIIHLNPKNFCFKQL